MKTIIICSSYHTTACTDRKPCTIYQGLIQ